MRERQAPSDRRNVTQRSAGSHRVIGLTTVVTAFMFLKMCVDKSASKRARYGEDNNVPLGFIPLTENEMMMSMALGMLMPLAIDDIWAIYETY